MLEYRESRLFKSIAHRHLSHFKVDYPQMQVNQRGSFWTNCLIPTWSKLYRPRRQSVKRIIPISNSLPVNLGTGKQISHAKQCTPFNEADIFGRGDTICIFPESETLLVWTMRTDVPQQGCHLRQPAVLLSPDYITSLCDST